MACCPIWCSPTRRNFTLSCASNIKTIVFGVGMHSWKVGEWVNARTQSLLWFGRPSQPLEGLTSFSCPQECTSRSRLYISVILEDELLPWAREHFEGAPCTFQQDSVPSHGSRMTQGWIQAHIPAFISKEDWPSRSPDLNSLKFSVWSILESKTYRTSHNYLENLKPKLQRKWALIPREVLCASCNAFQERLKQIIKNKGGHVE